MAAPRQAMPHRTRQIARSVPMIKPCLRRARRGRDDLRGFGCGFFDPPPDAAPDDAEREEVAEYRLSATRGLPPLFPAAMPAARTW